ncbi:MAG: SurA N-terminal domain-containing protein [Rhodospirillales bacterium]
MLDVMRRRAGTWVFRILAVFLIASFGLWGIGDYVHRMEVPDTAAEVGGTTISVRELSAQYRRQLAQLRASLGPAFDPQSAQRLGLAEHTIESMVADRLFQVEARRLGVTVPDALVVEQVHREPAFHNQVGQFDRMLFDRVLQQNDMTEDSFVGGLREQMVRAQLVNALTAGFVAPQALADAVYRYRNEKRVADVVLVPFSEVGDVGEPDETALAAFHEANRELFSRPELREITFATIDTQAIADRLKPSDARIKEEYENRRASLSVPERRAVRQIFARDEAAIRAAAQALAGGATLEDAAKAAGDDKASVVDLGTVAQPDLPIKALADQAFALPAGKAGEPVQSPLGWHILQVDKVEPGHTPPLEEVREAIARDVAHEEAVEAAVGVANRLEDTLGGGATLDDAAARLDLKLTAHTIIDAQGHGPDGKPVDGLPQDPNFLRTAFEQEAGQLSTLREMENGSFYMIRVDRIDPSALRPLAEVRDAAVAAWKRNQREEAARKKAEEIAGKVTPEKSLAEVAREMELRVDTTRPFGRVALDAEAGVPAALAAALFRVGPGQAATAQGDNAYAVGQVVRVVAADPAADQQGRERLRNALTGSLANDIQLQYAAELRTRYGVSINQKAVTQVYPSLQ